MNPFRKLANWYFTKNALPYWCILILDMLLLLAGGLFIYSLFVYHQLGEVDMMKLVRTLGMYVLPSLIGAKLFHTYSGIIRYSSFVDLMRVAYANAVSLVVVYPWHFFIYTLPTELFYHLHYRHIILMYVIGTALMWGLRALVKNLFDVLTTDHQALRALVYSVMEGGIGLAKNLRNQRPRNFVIKGFISSNDIYKHNLVMGERVYPADGNLTTVITRFRIKAVLVPFAMIDDFRSQPDLQDELLSAGVKIFMAQHELEVNTEDEQLAGGEKALQLKEVSVEDLLPRDEIKVDMKSVGVLLRGKRIMITGSAGSIGSEMVRQIAVYHPEALMLIDQAETPEHDVRLMMARDFPDITAETIVTSICKKDRMEKIFSEFRPDYVFHAAAYKHVPMMEDNPSEAVQNNIYGTKVIADLSVKYGVKKFVMVSTDKAVNPTNVMGCSKRICEIYVQSLDREMKYQTLQEAKSGSLKAPNMPHTQFVTTRFGNVLGSNGSVIPLFQEQIKKGGPVTVTHKDIIRYFMLIPEACKLVLEAGTKGNGGEIFVFDMGKPVRIADLAARMIRLSGARNVKIEYTGLRDGEKLYEEVLNEAENTKPTFHEKIRIAEVREYDFHEISKEVDELIALSSHYDDMATVRKMKEIVPEFKSNNSKYEEIDKEMREASEVQTAKIHHLNV